MVNFGILTWRRRYPDPLSYSPSCEACVLAWMESLSGEVCCGNMAFQVVFTQLLGVFLFPRCTAGSLLRTLVYHILLGTAILETVLPCQWEVELRAFGSASSA